MPTTLFQRKIEHPETMIAMTLVGFLGACGSGAGSTAAPAVANRAPVFDQASYELTLQENEMPLTIVPVFS